MQPEPQTPELVLPYHTASRAHVPFPGWLAAALVAMAQTVHAATPINDQCSGAVSLAFDPFFSPMTHQMNTGAATDTGDPKPVCQPNFGKGVWYYVTSRIDGVLLLDTCSSTFDTVLQAYTGTCGALTPLACSNETGQDCSGTRVSLSFPIAAAQPYRILVGGMNGASGSLAIRARFAQVHPTVSSPYTRVAITNEAGNISAKVSINYGDSCGMVRTWGTPVQSGLNFVADAQCVRLLGYGCAAVVVTKTNTYALGRLAPGQYAFHWRNFGSNILSVPFTVAAPATPSATHETVQTCCPGSSVFVTNSFSYSGSLVSLAWRPTLPAGWTLATASGTGNPRVSGGQILWNQPPTQNPVAMTYEIRGRAGADGLMTLRAEVDYQLAGMATSARVAVSPDPLRVGPAVSLQWGALSNGQLQLTVHGAAPGVLELQATAQLASGVWTPVGRVTNFSGTTTVTLFGVNSYPKRFYRARPICQRTTNTVVNCAVNQLAARLQISPDAISVLREELVWWPDSCQGCYPRDRGCFSVVTQAYDIVLAANGRLHYLRAHPQGLSVFICDTGPDGVPSGWGGDDARISLSPCP